MLTDFQKIGAIRDLTGKLIKLGIMEKVQDWRILENEACISVARAQVDFKNGDRMVVTRRGFTMWTFYKKDGVWKWPEPVTYWFDDAEPEEYKTFVTTAEEYTSRKQWEEMCYRPGTSQYPLDGPNARLT
jgi:hypothetical protein